MRTQANRLLSKEGRIERMLGICQDITPLRNLNEALFQEKERMAITLDSIGEAVISTDKEMRVAFMNPVAEKMSGWSQEQAAGQPLSELLHITQGRNGPEVESLLLCQLPPEKVTPVSLKIWCCIPRTAAISIFTTASRRCVRKRVWNRGGDGHSGCE